MGDTAFCISVAVETIEDLTGGSGNRHTTHLSQTVTDPTCYNSLAPEDGLAPDTALTLQAYLHHARLTAVLEDTAWLAILRDVTGAHAHGRIHSHEDMPAGWRVPTNIVRAYPACLPEPMPVLLQWHVPSQRLVAIPTPAYLLSNRSLLAGAEGSPVHRKQHAVEGALAGDLAGCITWPPATPRAACALQQTKPQRVSMCLPAGEGTYTCMAVFRPAALGQLCA
jgi:hypothetical protein